MSTKCAEFQYEAKTLFSCIFCFFQKNLNLKRIIVIKPNTKSIFLKKIFDYFHYRFYFLKMIMIFAHFFQIKINTKISKILYFSYMIWNYMIIFRKTWKMWKNTLKEGFSPLLILRNRHPPASPTSKWNLILEMGWWF